MGYVKRSAESDICVRRQDMKRTVITADPKVEPMQDLKIDRSGREPAGGYSYQFVLSPPELVKCVICHHPSKDPHLSECCGHIFCATCLQQCKTTPNVEHVCPMCKDSSFKHISNKQIDREVRSLKIYCDNKKKGCTWQGEINDIDTHLKNDNGCRYEVVECAHKCKMTMQRRYLVDHECPRRKVNCQYCHINGEWKFIEGKHREECNKFPLSCPNKCEIGSVPREHMEAHRKECPLEIIQCEYHNVGCDVRMARKRKRSHLEKDMEVHLHMTKLKLAKTEDKLLSTEKRVSNLEMMWSCLLQNNVGADNTNRVSNAVAMLQNSTGPSLATNWASQLETFATTLNETCPVIIKLPQLASHLNSRNMWCSSPFYTDKDGYRMRVYAKISDDGNRLSVGLHLMKGPHDDKLPWPLRRKFEIKLMNQISDSEHHSDMLMFNDKVSSRVTNDNAVRILGFPMFISLEALHRVTTTCQFYKNDCLFVLVTTG